ELLSSHSYTYPQCDSHFRRTATLRLTHTRARAVTRVQIHSRSGMRSCLCGDAPQSRQTRPCIQRSVRFVTDALGTSYNSNHSQASISRKLGGVIHNLRGCHRVTMALLLGSNHVQDSEFIRQGPVLLLGEACPQLPYAAV